MDQRGGRTIPVAYMLMISFVLGLLVVLIHPDYRRAALHILRGERDLAPVWISNEIYYPEVALPETEPDDAE